MLGKSGILNKLLLAATLTLAFAGAAHASLITLSTRYSEAPVHSSAAGYAALLTGLETSAATTGYGDTILASFENVANNQTFVDGSSRNIAYDFTILFGVSQADAGNWAFRFGVDFGHGGAVFLDGQAVALGGSDMWWAGTYNNSGSFNLSAILAAGNHTLRIVGLEDGFDGGVQGQFRAPNAAFTTFASNDGRNATTSNVANVPEPASMLLFAGGIAGLSVARSRLTARSRGKSVA